ncbi:MAG: N-6 DNA methylase, partial [Chloroflexota bacterium]|nr:N-6 DNA methylase [Chloroflexota bacterium]
MPTNVRVANYHRKSRGAFFTPPVIARHIANWAIRSPTDRVLDPSCGDGVFLLEAAQRLADMGRSPQQIAHQIQGIELDPGDAAICRARLRHALCGHEPRVVVCDFLSAFRNGLHEQRFTAVVGNPPYIRYQSFNGPSREAALEIVSGFGIRPNKLMNSWVPFVLAAGHLTEDDGRLGMVLPAELLQVTYAAPVRQVLKRTFKRIVIEGFASLVFPGVEEETVILLASRSGGNLLRFVELAGLDDLSDDTDLTADYAPESGEGWADEESPVRWAAGKWTELLLTRRERTLLNECASHPAVVRLGELAEVDVGVVTGANGFFILDASAAESLNAQGYLLPAVPRTSHIRGVIYSQRDFEENRRAGLRCQMLVIPSERGARLPDGLRKY